MSDARALAAYVGAFVDELVRAGVRQACVAPGSRSTPLALALARHPDVRVWMHLDERSAAFFALGMAKWSGRPVALLCTSGTAAANFLPAVAEARHGRVPLVVLTADRPPELRDVGAAQTIDQTRLFGTHAKWFVDVALPEATPEMLRYVRTLAGRATALAAAAPAGPVHLNFPFREPLVPAWDAAAAAAVAEGVARDATGAGDALARGGRADGAPWVRVTPAGGALDEGTVRRLAAALRAAARPVVVCGPQPDPALAAPLARLAEAVGAPLLADPLSQLRWGAHGRGVVVDAYDAFLRVDAVVAALAPDLVVRVGATPTSKPVLQWMQRHPGARVVVVDAGWSEPTHLAAEVVQGEPGAVCEALGRAMEAEREAERGPPPAGNAAPPAVVRTTDPTRDGADARAECARARSAGWLTRWRVVDAAARRALDAHADGLAEPFEGRVLRDVAAALPAGATLWVSSSMPVRDLDAFAPGDARRLRVLANRGANGIDGVVSSALGAAAAAAEAGEGPLVLVAGDLAFYHDMNGLLAARLHGLDATVVLVNNDGGGIFSFLPQAAQPEHFERLFGTPHGLDFRHAAALYGASHACVEGPAEIGAAVRAAAGRAGLDVLEVRTERTRNVALHREAWRAVARAVGAALADSVRDESTSDAAAKDAPATEAATLDAPATASSAGGSIDDSSGGPGQGDGAGAEVGRAEDASSGEAVAPASRA